MYIKALAVATAMVFALGAGIANAQPAPDDETDERLAKATKPAFERTDDSTRGAGERSYTVRKGDSLSRIARRFYGNSVLWQPILNANADKVKAGGRLIFPGTVLTIPDLDAAAPQVQPVRAKEGNTRLTIVTGNDYKPFTDKSLPEGGLFTELVRTAMTRAGYDPEIEFLPWDYAMRATQAGTFKASFPWYETADRREALWYSRPVYEVLIVVYHKTGAPLEFEGIDDLDGLNLCRPEGYFDDDIREKVAEGRIVRTAPETPANCFEMLVEGDVDVVSLSAMVGNGEIIKLGLDGEIDVADTPLAIRPLHIVYPKFDARSRGTMGKIDLELRKMEEEGVMAAIIEKHLRAHFAGLEKAAQEQEVASGN